jgi:hypothetical protein
MALLALYCRKENIGAKGYTVFANIFYEDHKNAVDQSHFYPHSTIWRFQLQTAAEASSKLSVLGPIGRSGSYSDQ